jgi:hypothetical protein
VNDVPLKRLKDPLQTTRKIEHTKAIVFAHPPYVSHQQSDFRECLIHNVHAFHAFGTIHAMRHCLLSTGKINHHCKSSLSLTSRMVSTWTRRSTTLEMMGIFAFKEVPCSDLRDSMIALSGTFLFSTMGSDEVTLGRGAERDKTMNVREIASLVDSRTHGRVD